MGSQGPVFGRMPLGAFNADHFYADLETKTVNTSNSTTLAATAVMIELTIIRELRRRIAARSPFMRMRKRAPKAALAPGSSVKARRARSSILSVVRRIQCENTATATTVREKMRKDSATENAELSEHDKGAGIDRMGRKGTE